MKKHDLLVAFIAALVLECSIATLFVYAPSHFVIFLHVIPLFLLSFVEPATAGRFSTLFNSLVFVTQVLVWTSCCWGLLRVWHKSRPRQRRFVATTLCLLLLALFAAASTLRISRRSIQILAETDCACGDYHEEVTGLIVLNPLRNRAPEISATEFLSAMKSGKCSTSIAQELCDYGLNRARPVLQWKLRNRKDQGNTVSLFYVVKGRYREGIDIYPKDAWGEAMVQAERTGSQWKVTSYSAYY